MRNVASAIIIASACAVFIGAAYVKHSDSSMALTILGLVVGAIGVHGWFKAAKPDARGSGKNVRFRTVPPRPPIYQSLG
ncbi:MAG: hypothetical protein ACPGVU_02955 [Limisphaerales bacterium]